MPYIEAKDRHRLDMQGWKGADNPGELNYLLSSLCKEYLHIKGESYQVYNDIVGALECCKLEIYRRRISGYEDKKRWKNGDVWEEKESDPPVDTWGRVI